VFEGAFGAALMSDTGVTCADAERANPIAPQRVKSFFILTGLILEWEGKKSFNMQISWLKKKVPQLRDFSFEGKLVNYFTIISLVKFEEPAVIV
jgi:hypothetical protein